MPDTTTTTPTPVELVKSAVKALQDQKAALEKQVADIERQLDDIAAAITGEPRRGRPGRKPGRKGGPGRKPTPVPEEDKTKLLAAMKAIGGKMRSGDVYKKAGMDKAQGQKALKALRKDKAVKVAGPWISVA